MRRLALRFGVAAIACIVGIVTSIVLSNVRSSSSECCPDGLVTVQRDHNLRESWPEAPALLSVLEVERSYDLSEVDITFDVKSLNGKS